MFMQSWTPCLQRMQGTQVGQSLTLRGTSGRNLQEAGVDENATAHIGFSRKVLRQSEVLMDARQC